MTNFVGADDFLVHPEDLQAFAWSATLRVLAEKVGLSDVGLRKILVSAGMILPPQGYWNRVHAGRSVPERPAAHARRPGETGRIRISGRFKGLLTAAEPMSSEGPFASAFVPEDLDELFGLEKQALGTVRVPRDVARQHEELGRFLAQKERRQKQRQERGIYAEPLIPEPPSAGREVRIANALLLALGKRGYDGRVGEIEGHLEITFVVGAMHVIVKFGLERQSRAARPVPYSARAESGKLVLRIAGEADGGGTNCWTDDQTGKLEAKLGTACAAVIVAGEAAFRKHLRDNEGWQKQRDLLDQKWRQEQLEAVNRRRLEELRKSGDLLRQAEDLRSLVQAVKLAVLEGTANVEPAALCAWEAWALAEADRIDPVKSGQIMKHIPA